MEHPDLVPPANAFADAMTILAITADPKGARQRIDDIMNAVAKLEAAKQATEAAQSALVKETAEKRTELDRRSSRLDAYEERLAERERTVEGAWNKIKNAIEEVRLLDKQMRRAVTTYSLEQFDERLQTLPSWEQLHESIFGNPDPHFDGNGGADTMENEQVPDVPAGVSLSRSRRRDRRGADQ